MIIRLFALSAMVGAFGCLSGATSSPATVGLYYSFDTPLPAGAFNQMQAELDRILEPAGIAVEWRSLAADQNPADDFPEVFVFRFRGVCSIDGTPNRQRVAGTESVLAATQVADHQVLPFGEVECGVLGRTVGNDLLMGRAMARVIAHELYHMWTGSSSHGRSGIARAAYSREDLTSASFLFAEKERAWIRRWAATQTAAAEAH